MKELIAVVDRVEAADGALHELSKSKDRRKMRVLLRERDGDDCHWCGERMRFSEGEPMVNSDQNFASIEHLVERRRGGSNDPSNLVLAHHRCNRQRDRNQALTAAALRARAASIRKEQDDG